MCRFGCACGGSLIVLTVSPTRAFGVQRIFPIPMSNRMVDGWLLATVVDIDGNIALCAAYRYFVTSFGAIDHIILVFLPSPLSYYDCSQTLLLEWNRIHWCDCLTGLATTKQEKQCKKAFTSVRPFIQYVTLLVHENRQHTSYGLTLIVWYIALKESLRYSPFYPQQSILHSHFLRFHCAKCYHTLSMNRRSFRLAI